MPPIQLRAAFGAALLALALPAGARANATVSRDAMTDVVTVSSTATESNDIVVLDNTGTLVVQEQDPIVAGLDAGTGCSTVSAKVVTCGATSTAAAVIAHLGPGSDIFRSTSDAAKDIPRRLDGEAGNDQLFGSDANDRLDGGIGNDVLDGGAGVDTISYDRLGSATVTARFPDASDNPATVNGVLVGTTTGNGETTGENDTLTSRDENFQGGAEADDVTGNGADNVLNGSGGNDSLSGLAGNDTLQGVDGNDTLTGGGGTDTFSAGTGDDAVLARDGIPETAIDCGTGTGDKLEADNATDTVDKPTTACETLAPQRTSGTGMVAGATQEGDILTAPLATYSGDAVTSRAYAWLRCTAAGSGCSTISGQTARTYTLTAADIGKYVSATETASNAAGADSGFADYIGPVAVRAATGGNGGGTGGTGGDTTGATGTGGGVQPAQAGTALPTGPAVVDPVTLAPNAPTLSTGAKPKATTIGKRVLVDTGLRLGCPAHGPTCSVDVRGSARRTKAAKPSLIGHTTLRLKAGKQTWVTFALTPAGAKLLHSAHRLKVTLTITTTTGTTRTTRTKTITVGAPKAPKRKRRA